MIPMLYVSSYGTETDKKQTYWRINLLHETQLFFRG